MHSYAVIVSRLSLLLFTLVVGAACSSGGGSAETFPPATGADPPPAAPATTAVITGVTFDWASHKRMAEGSDNWPTTWSDDDHQYALFGDGEGFGNREEITGRASFGVARIEGDRDNFIGVNRYGGRNAECASQIEGKGHGAPLSIGGVLYAWITPKSNQAGYDSFTLHRSVDKGCSWTELAVSFVQATEGISYGSFVQFGKDNTLAQDGYVYTVAPEITNTQSLLILQRPGRIMLLRAPTATIEDRGTYEYYAGQDATGQPLWSPDPTRKAPIYEDPAGVGPFPQMAFVPALNRLVYTNEHGDGVSDAARNSLLTMAEAPQPWGPWLVIYKDLFFPQNEQTVFQWNFAPKWFSPDGLQFTLIFSGDETNDSWNTINGTFSIQ